MMDVTIREQLFAAAAYVLLEPIVLLNSCARRLSAEKGAPLTLKWRFRLLFSVFLAVCWSYPLSRSKAAKIGDAWYLRFSWHTVSHALVQAPVWDDESPAFVWAS